MEHAEFLRVLSRTMAEMSNADVNEGTRSSLFQIADEIDRLRRGERKYGGRVRHIERVPAGDLSRTGVSRRAHGDAPP